MAIVLPRRNTDQVKVTGAKLTDIVEHRENFDGGLGRIEHRSGYGPVYASEPGSGGRLGAVGIFGFEPIGPFSAFPGPITEIEWSPDGATLYATTGGGNDTIHTVDPSNGAVLTTVTLSVGGAVNGLEFDQSGTLLGTHITGPGNPSALYSINPDTGVMALIGLTGIAGAIGGLAFDPSFGTLYGMTSGGSPARLLTIVPGTGVATVVGVSSASVEMSSLEFTADGRLIAGGHDGTLYEIDPSTAVARRIGPLGTTKVSGLSMRPIFPGPRVHDIGISKNDFVAQSAQRVLRQFVRVPDGSPGLVQPEKVGGLLFPTEETP